MKSREDIEQLKPFEARAIIENLRKGSVPVEYVPFFTVGRNNWLKFIVDDLEKYIAKGGSKIRFINGDYGDGKTHFMSVVKHLSEKKQFAVSFVVLTREVPIHKFEVIYQQIVKQLSGSFDGQGIRNLVDHWAAGLIGELQVKDNDLFIKKLAEVGDRLRTLPGMNLNFANALAGLLNYRFSPLLKGGDEEVRKQALETLYQWFEGAKVSKKDLKPFQIFESLNKTNSKSFLRALVSFLRYLNYEGLVLLLDELETVIAQSTSVRNAAYENVRLLIDNTEHVSHLHIFFSIIPDVLSSEKGFKSYDALWSRVRSIGEGQDLNYRGVLIDLHRTPLEIKELIDLGITLRHIHEVSYRWDARELVKDTLIEDICKLQERMGVLNEVRLFIKQVISFLDMAEQGKVPETETDLIGHITTSQRQVEQEKLEQLQPKWDS